MEIVRKNLAFEVDEQPTLSLPQDNER
jgi:hypothetical protein